MSYVSEIVKLFEEMGNFELIGCLGIFSGDGLAMYVNSGCPTTPEFEAYGGRLVDLLEKTTSAIEGIVQGEKVREFVLITESDEDMVYSVHKIHEDIFLILRCSKSKYESIRKFIAAVHVRLRESISSL